MSAETLRDACVMTGTVLCPDCGDQLVSNTGKIQWNHRERLVHCWGCKRGYSAEAVYLQRRPGQVVTYDPNQGARPR